VKYKQALHDGEHEAIVDESVFQRVQTMLARNGRSGGTEVRNQLGAILKRHSFHHSAVRPRQEGHPKLVETDDETPQDATRGRHQRVTRLMALAIHFDELIRAGGVRNYAESPALAT